MLKRRAITTGFFDSSNADATSSSSSSAGAGAAAAAAAAVAAASTASAGGRVFGIPLQQVLDNEREAAELAGGAGGTVSGAQLLVK